jgi:hypothetical protein
MATGNDYTSPVQKLLVNNHRLRHGRELADCRLLGYDPAKSADSNAVDRLPYRLASAWFLSSEVGHPGS